LLKPRCLLFLRELKKGLPKGLLFTIFTSSLNKSHQLQAYLKLVFLCLKPNVAQTALGFVFANKAHKEIENYFFGFFTVSTTVVFL